MLPSRLIEQFIEEGYLQTPRIIEAFRAVCRKDFLPHEKEADPMEDERRFMAEIDAALPIGYGQTISQPYTVAFMLEQLQPKESDRVLDVGTGSGWQAALLAHIVGPSGMVVTVERIPELAQSAKKNIEKYPFNNMHFIVGDGNLGFPKEAPYDRIIVAAAAQDKIPRELITQLANGGRLLIPVGSEKQSLFMLTKNAKGKITQKEFPGFQFVPLVQHH